MTKGGMCGQGCMAGGHAWYGGVCMVEAMHSRGACMAGGVHGGDLCGGGHAWQGVHGGGTCMAGQTATATYGTHPTGMHSCLSFNRAAALRAIIV